MEKNKVEEEKKKKSIWKSAHTPLKERKCSSGLTFRCEEIAVDEQKRSKL